MEGAPTPTTSADSSPAPRRAPEPGAGSSTRRAPGPPSGRRTAARTAARTVCAWVLVVLTAVTVPIAVMTVWIVATLTSTAQYVATVGPIVRQRVVTTHLAQRGTTLLFQRVNVAGHLAKLVPSGLSFVVQPLTAELQHIVENQFRRVLESSWFQRFWDQANAAAHANVVGLLTGKPTAHARAVHQVVVTLTPVVQRAVAGLDHRGIHLFDGAAHALARTNTFRLRILSSTQLGRAQHLFSILTTVNWAVPVAAAVLLIGAVAVGPDHRAVLLRAAVGSAITTLVLLGALAASRSFVVARAGSHNVSSDVSGVIFDVAVRYLRHAWWIALVIEAAVAVGALAAGPSRPARAVRAGVVATGRWIGAVISRRHTGSPGSAPRSR